MPTPSPAGRRRSLVVRLLRYAGASAVSTVVGLTVLGILVGAFGWTAGWANVVATGIGTIPSFELNRRWVWGCTDRRDLGRQVVPFAALSFLSLLLSTLAVHLAAAWADSRGYGRVERTVAVELANLLSFGSLWVVQYVVLDRVLFGAGRRRSVA